MIDKRCKSSVGESSHGESISNELDVGTVQISQNDLLIVKMK